MSIFCHPTYLQFWGFGGSKWIVFLPSGSMFHKNIKLSTKALFNSFQLITLCIDFAIPTLTFSGGRVT